MLFRGVHCNLQDTTETHTVLFKSSIMIFLLLQFKRHTGVYYTHLCDLLTLELKFEVRSLLRKVFMRIGQDFHIVHDPIGS